jgi:hypothetical protein
MNQPGIHKLMFWECLESGKWANSDIATFVDISFFVINSQFVINSFFVIRLSSYAWYKSLCATCFLLFCRQLPFLLHTNGLVISPTIHTHDVGGVFVVCCVYVDLLSLPNWSEYMWVPLPVECSYLLVVSTTVVLCMCVVCLYMYSERVRFGCLFV